MAEKLTASINAEDIIIVLRCKEGKFQVQKACTILDHNQALEMYEALRACLDCSL